RPRVVTALRGARRIGARLTVVGRVTPRVAGVLTLTEGGRVRSVTVAPGGRFRMQLTTTRLYRYRAIVRLQPAAGYVGWRKAYPVRVELRQLEVGSTGPAGGLARVSPAPARSLRPPGGRQRLRRVDRGRGARLPEGAR